MQNATYDTIVSSIHVLWERGWKVNPESVQEMLKRGQNTASLEKIESVLKEMVVPGAREQWLKGFNWESPWAKEHGFPWAIAEGEPWEVGDDE